MEGTTRDLFQAIGWGQLDRVKELLASGVPVNQPEGDNSPLTWAAKAGETEIVKVLLAAGADIHAVDQFNTTALTAAAHRGRVETVRVLIAAGANLNQQSDPYTPLGAAYTPLGAAAVDRTTARLEIVKALIAAGADVNFGKWPPLMWASRSSSPKVVKALIAAGAQVNLIGSWGLPLFYAILDNRADNVAILLEAGADPQLRLPADFANADMAGKTALEFARARKAKKIVALLESPREPGAPKEKKPKGKKAGG